MKQDTDIGAFLIGFFGLLTGGALLFVLLSMLSVFVESWALVTLWGWIAVPTFHMPELLYWQAYGIVVIVGFLSSHSMSLGQYQRDLDTKTSTSTSIIWGITNILGPVFTVFFTWFVLHFLFAVI